jgi:hypothetical protein
LTSAPNSVNTSLVTYPRGVTIYLSIPLHKIPYPQNYDATLVCMASQMSRTIYPL